MSLKHAAKFFLLVIFMVSLVSTACAVGSPFDVQTQFLEAVRQERVMVMITMVSGDKLEGYVKAFDDQVVLVESGGDLLLYKHAISAVTASDGNFQLLLDKL